MLKIKSINFLISTILLLVFFLIAMPLRAAEKYEDSMFNLPLEEVMDVQIITASRRDESAENAPGIISVITRKQIEQTGARGLTDILNMVPGFSNGAWANSTSIYVRGAYSEGKSNNILLMVDGRRINTCFHGNAFEHYDLPVSNIKQVEIIRGPGSVLYGANASVAVVNIITQSGEEIDGAELSYRAGSFESHYGWIKAGKRVNDDFEYSISGNITKYNNTSLPHINYTVSGDNYTNLKGADIHDIYSGEGKITFKDFTFYASYIDSSHGLSGAGLDKSFDVEEFLSGSDKDEYSFGVIHKYKYLDNINITSSLTYGDYHNEFTSVAAGFPQYYSAVGNGLKAETVSKTWSDYFDGEVNIDWYLSEKHLFLIGLNFRKETTKSENWRDMVWGVIGGETVVTGRTDPYLVNTAIDSETREIHAEYAQYTFKPSGFLSFTGGIRLDNYNDAGNAMNPRLSVVMKPIETVTVKALFGQAFRAPSFFEQYYSFPGYYSPPDSILDPEKIKTYEIQTCYRQDPCLSLSVNIFYYKVEDVIRLLPTADPSDPVAMSQFVNSGTRHSTGFEAELYIMPMDQVTLFANYSTAHAKDKLKGVEIDVAGVPRHSINAGATFEIVEKIDLSLTVHHRMDWKKMPGTPGVVNDLELPDYTLLNFHMKLHDILPFLKRFDVTFDVFNALNETMVSATPQLISYPSGIPRGERQFLAGVHYRF